MIRTESLSKTFQSDHREIKAVDGLNLQVNEGEVFGFLGNCQVLYGYGDTLGLHLLQLLDRYELGLRRPVEHQVR